MATPNNIDPVSAARFSKWYSEASTPIRKRFLTLAKATMNTAWQWTIRRNFSAARAGEVVEAMRLIAKTEEKAPRPLTRGDLCKACRECEYFKNGMAIDEDDLK